MSSHIDEYMYPLELTAKVKKSLPTTSIQIDGLDVLTVFIAETCCK
jgi:hypothetical protein